MVVVFESSLPPSIGEFSLTATVETATKPAVGLKAVVAIRVDAIKPPTHPATTVDPWELHLLLVELKDWELIGDHHMHKNQQFQSCQQALEWHSLAQALSECHGHHCLFYLGSVGCGRIETDILSPIQGHLTRADLDLAIKLNALEKTVRRH